MTPQPPMDRALVQEPLEDGRHHPGGSSTGARIALSDRRKERVLQRLRRIEGQIRGIQRMIEDEKYCVDVLVQVAAARAALDKVGLALLEDHTRGCVARALREGDGAEEALDELMEVVLRFVR